MRSSATRLAWLAVTVLPMQSTSAPAQQGPQLRHAIAASLVVADADRMQPSTWPREPEVIALYFGADWCGPCHAFVPTLIQVRDALRDAGADTEVVYVSLDESEAQMRRSMREQHMPWPAIDYRRIRHLPALRRLAGAAPPNLVVLDRDGRVIANAWDGRRYSGLQPALKAWTVAVEQHEVVRAPDPAARALDAME